jgi:hypothetical protein
MCKMEKNCGTMRTDKNALIIGINEKIHKNELYRNQQ